VCVNIFAKRLLLVFLFLMEHVVDEMSGEADEISVDNVECEKKKIFYMLYEE